MAFTSKYPFIINRLLASFLALPASISCDGCQDKAKNAEEPIAPVKLSRTQLHFSACESRPVFSERLHSLRPVQLEPPDEPGNNHQTDDLRQ